MKIFLVFMMLCGLVSAEEKVEEKSTVKKESVVKENEITENFMDYFLVKDEWELMQITNGKDQEPQTTIFKCKKMVGKDGHITEEEKSEDTLNVMSFELKDDRILLTRYDIDAQNFKIVTIFENPIVLLSKEMFEKKEGEFKFSNTMSTSITNNGEKPTLDKTEVKGTQSWKFHKSFEGHENVLIVNAEGQRNEKDSFKEKYVFVKGKGLVEFTYEMEPFSFTKKMVLKGDEALVEGVVESEFDDLSKKFLKALQSGKIDELQKCWLDLPAAKANFEGKAPADEMAKLETYWAARDKFIAEWLSKILKFLKEQEIKVEGLTYLKTEAKVRERDGMKKTSRFDIFFKAKSGEIINIGIDDGILVNQQWFFTDKPYDSISVEKNGKNVYHSLK